MSEDTDFVPYRKMSKNEEPETVSAPPDTYNIVYAVMLLIGMGMLCTYNALITAGDFFQDLFGDDIMFYVTLVISYPSPVFQLIMILWGNRVSFTKRFVVVFLCQAVLMVFVPVISGILDKDSTFFKVLFFVCCFLMGSFTSILNSTGFGLAGLFPPKYMQAVMSGQGVAGLTISILRIISKASFSSDEEGNRKSAILYFSLSSLIVLCCIAGYLFILRLPFAQFYIRNESSAESNAPAKSNKKSGYEQLYDTETVDKEAADLPDVVGDQYTTDSSINTKADSNDRTPTPKTTIILRAVKKCLLLGFTVLLVFFGTFLCFPSLTLNLRSEHISKDWYGVLLITEFNFFDLIGRSLPGVIVIFNKRNLIWPTLLRLAFFPLFVLCVDPKVFTSDVWAYVFMAIFATTNGYLGSLAMIFGPSVVDDEEKEYAGYFMSLVLNGGILLGSTFALVFNKLNVGITHD